MADGAGMTDNGGPHIGEMPGGWHAHRLFERLAGGGPPVVHTDGGRIPSDDPATSRAPRGAPIPQVSWAPMVSPGNDELGRHAPLAAAPERSGPRGPHSFLDVPGAAPATKHSAANWVFISLVGFLLGQIAGYVLAVAAAAVTHDNAAAVAKLAAPPEWYIVSSLIGVWIGFGVAPVVASHVAGTGRVVADLGVRFRPADALGIVIGVAAQYAIWLAYYPFRSHLHDYEAPVTKLTGSSHGGGLLVIGILTVVAAPFFEELFFRGLLFKGLARLCTPADGRPSPGRTWGVVAAVVADGLLFALAHFELEQFAGLAAFGMVLAAVSYRTNRLGMNTVAHASFNLVTVAMLASAGLR
jgi:membrane protease YdiL (CAAX protease family)